jgi:hypothetical protein
MAGTGKLPLEDDLLLQATFDFAMIPRSLVPPLVKRMRTFYETELQPRNIVKTIPELADILERALQEVPDALGVCFNCCSANTSYWTVKDETQDDSHPRNILTDLGEATWLDEKYFKALIQETPCQEEKS